MIRQTSRALGYTFIEVTLALGLALILVAGIYSAVQMTYQQWEIGRQSADESQLVRSLFQRMRADMQSAMTSWTPPTAVVPGAAPASGATAAGGASAATGAAAATAASGAASGGSAGGSSTSDNPTEFPPGGVYGGPSAISLVVHAPPADLDFSQNLRPGTTASVLRTVSYRIGSIENNDDIDAGVEGLLRDESPQTPDPNSPDGHSSDMRSDLMAPEVEGLKVSYYDGLFWNDSWDSLQTGPPVCVQIEVGMRMKTKRNADSDGLRWYKATIYFPPAAEVSEAAAATSAGGAATGGTSTGGASTGGAATGGAPTGGAGS